LKRFAPVPHYMVLETSPRGDVPGAATRVVSLPFL
jgi:hypothetical protein